MTKLSAVSNSELLRAQKICTAAIKDGEGITVRFPNRAAALALRTRIYQARQQLRRENTNDSSPVSIVDMRLIEQDGAYVLKIYPPGMYVLDLEIVGSAGQAIDLKEDLLETVETGLVDDETGEGWLYATLLEVLPKYIRKANLAASRDKEILSWEEITHLLFEAGIRAKRKPKTYDDPLSRQESTEELRNEEVEAFKAKNRERAKRIAELKGVE